jgi:hypothetical protein
MVRSEVVYVSLVGEAAGKECTSAMMVVACGGIDEAVLLVDAPGWDPETAQFPDPFGDAYSDHVARCICSSLHFHVHVQITCFQAKVSEVESHFIRDIVLWCL